MLYKLFLPGKWLPEFTRLETRVLISIRQILKQLSLNIASLKKQGGWQYLHYWWHLRSQGALPPILLAISDNLEKNRNMGISVRFWNVSFNVNYFVYRMSYPAKKHHRILAFFSSELYSTCDRSQSIEICVNVPMCTFFL